MYESCFGIDNDKGYCLSLQIQIVYKITWIMNSTSTRNIYSHENDSLIVWYDATLMSIYLVVFLQHERSRAAFPLTFGLLLLPHNKQ